MDFKKKKLKVVIEVKIFLTNALFLQASAADTSVHNRTFFIILIMASTNDQPVSHIIILFFGLALHYALTALFGTWQ